EVLAWDRDKEASGGAGMARQDRSRPEPNQLRVAFPVARKFSSSCPVAFLWTWRLGGLRRRDERKCRSRSFPPDGKVPQKPSNRCSPGGPCMASSRPPRPEQALDPRRLSHAKGQGSGSAEPGTREPRLDLRERLRGQD